MPDTGWFRLRACRGVDPDVFFHDNGNYSRARQICASCPVRDDCLQECMEIEANLERTGHVARVGMFGGLTPNQRGQLAEGHRIAALRVA